MKDMRGIEIKIGDTICYNGAGHYKDLSTGVVFGFTKKGVRIRKSGWVVPTKEQIEEMSPWKRDRIEQEIRLGQVRPGGLVAVCTLPEVTS